MGDILNYRITELQEPIIESPDESGLTHWTFMPWKGKSKLVCFCFWQNKHLLCVYLHKTSKLFKNASFEEALGDSAQIKLWHTPWHEALHQLHFMLIMAESMLPHYTYKVLCKSLTTPVHVYYQFPFIWKINILGQKYIYMRICMAHNVGFFPNVLKLVCEQ